MTNPKLVLILTENWTMRPTPDVPDLVRWAVEAERAGIDAVMVSEHIVLGPSANAEGLPENPRDYALPGNQDPATPWPSPIVLLSAIAAATTRIRLVASAIISPLRHPLALAKDLATLDRLSGGRLVVQPTVSWHKDEYDALGVPFAQRGAILDEQLEIWAKAWSGEPFSHHGNHFSFCDVWVEPQPVRRGGPALWFGGSSLHPRLLARIERYGSGFNPLGAPSDADLLALKAAGCGPDAIEYVGGARGQFPGPDEVADLGQALAAIPGQQARGFRTFCVKPSQFLDDATQIGSFCDDLVRRIDTRSFGSLRSGGMAEYERLGSKVLRLPDVVAQSVGFMGPVFSSAFVIPLVVGVVSASGKGGGVAAPLSVLIAAVGVFAIGWIVSSYAREIHAAGSLYDYVSRGLGERLGVAAGWLYYSGIIILVTGLLMLIGGYLQGTIQSEFNVNPLPGWAWTLLVIALIGVVLYFGVQISTRAQLVLALVSMIVVGAFFIFVIAKLGSANSLKPFKPSSSADGWGGIFFGVLYGVLLFVGFETAANLAEETPKPNQHIPAAVMITAAIATVFFVLAAYVEVAGFHYSLKTITAAAGAPLFALGAAKSAGGYGGTWIDRLLELVVLFDMLAVAIGGSVAASRGVFAMARDRRLPSMLAATSKRTGTPLGATWFIIGASLLTLAATVWWKGLFALPGNPHYFSIFSWCSTFGGFALVVVYLMMAFGSVRSFRSPRLYVAAVLAVLIAGGAIFGSFYKVTSPTIEAPRYALAVLVLGYLSTFVLRSRKAASTELADLAKSSARS